MASLHEGIDFVGHAQLPSHWEDDVFRHCTFTRLDLEGQAFEGALIGCVLTESSWYWGLFNTTKFVEVEFRDCLFRGASFAGCTFTKCRFVNCRFTQDNLGAPCRFTDCDWFGCEQTGCEGLPEACGAKSPAAER